MKRQVDLAAVGMAAQGQRHALRHLLEDQRLMREQDDRRIVLDLPQRAGEIVEALEGMADRRPI